MYLPPINLNPAVNEQIHFTRRYPDLPKKVLLRDSKIAKALVMAWDMFKDGDRVLQIFLKEQKNLSDYRYWELLKTVWVLTGRTDRLDLFLPLFRSKRKQQHYFMTPEEHKRLRELPFPCAVYKASDDVELGISYTLSHSYADWFKEAFNKKAVFTRYPTEREEVFALIERNGEEELLILPS